MAVHTELRIIHVFTWREWMFLGFLYSVISSARFTTFKGIEAISECHRVLLHGQSGWSRPYLLRPSRSNEGKWQSHQRLIERCQRKKAYLQCLPNRHSLGEMFKVRCESPVTVPKRNVTVYVSQAISILITNVEERTARELVLNSKRARAMCNW